MINAILRVHLWNVVIVVPWIIDCMLLLLRDDQMVVLSVYYDCMCLLLTIGYNILNSAIDWHTDDSISYQCSIGSCCSNDWLV